MSFPTNANASPIKIYGGTRQDLSNAGYEFSTLVGGETHYATRYIAGYYTYSSDIKFQFRYTGATIFIIYSGQSLDHQKNVCVHEMGHALGYSGHSWISSDVMYYTSSSTYTLSDNEKKSP